MSVNQNIAISIYFAVFFGEIPSLDGLYNSTCGRDQSAIQKVSEGVAVIETYPWLGYLIYRSATSKIRFSTTVVLVTRQIALATASEIDQIPKYDFRSRARVVLGHNCSYPSIPVRDYAFHPDYVRLSHSALAIIQLNLDFVRQELIPICGPPSFFVESKFYAMTLTPNCKRPIVQIYEMEHVDPVQCKIYYRKSGLDLRALWPTHTACGKARHGGECLWRGGTVLAMKQSGRWRLLGFGIYGPGCGAPARFLDYGMYHEWVRQNVLRMGKPTITRLGPNQVILRRSLANLQRYGPCDVGEIKSELYTEETTITPDKVGHLRRVRYNMTIYAEVEYSCVVFRATNFDRTTEAPQLRLRRWCASTPPKCSGFQYIEIDFYIEVIFAGAMTFSIKAYGKKAIGIDIKRAMRYLNRFLSYPPIDTVEEVDEKLRQLKLLLADVRKSTTTPAPLVTHITTSRPRYPLPARTTPKPKKQF